MNKKYELLKDDTIEVEGHTLHRIRLLKDLGHVKAGTLGGYIEKEDNLSHSGECWVANEAKVYGDASVKENAIVRDYVHVYGESQVMHNAIVEGHARVFGNSTVFDDATVKDNGSVFDHGSVHGFAIVQDNATISENARVCSKAIVKDYAKVCGHIMVSQGTISNSAVLFGIGEINFDIAEKDDWTFYRNPCVDAGFITVSTKMDIWNYRFFTGTAEEFIDMFERVEDHHRIPNELEFMKALVKFHQDLYFKA